MFYQMPSYNGLQALTDTKEFDSLIPFILFTGSVNEEIAVQCMKAGANDYVIKEHITRLPYAVAEALENKATKAEGEKAVQALKESEAYFRSLIEYLSDYLLLTDSDGTIKFSNPSFNELIGYTPSEIIGENAFKLIFPGDVEYIKSELKSFLANPEIIREVNIHVVHKNGKSIFLRGKAQNLLTHSLFDGILLNLQDITVLKLAEQALREKKRQIIESNQIMAGILENTHMMAVFLDTKFNFIWVNKAYANTCKKTPTFFQDKNHFDLYSDKETQAIFMRVVDTGEPFFVTAKSFEFPDQPERGITYWD
jgi:PAS domain S-box-containing protein